MHIFHRKLHILIVSFTAFSIFYSSAFAFTPEQIIAQFNKGDRKFLKSLVCNRSSNNKYCNFFDEHYNDIEIFADFNEFKILFLHCPDEVYFVFNKNMIGKDGWNLVYTLELDNQKSLVSAEMIGSDILLTTRDFSRSG
ncbi:MAG: hypothetical protein V1816_13610, partial [Pseudomonadota bacterium]